MKRALALCLAGLGCSANGGSPPASKPAALPPAPVAAATEQMLYEDASKGLLLQIRRGQDACKLYDAAGQVFGEVKVQADRVKLRDAQSGNSASTGSARRYCAVRM